MAPASKRWTHHQTTGLPEGDAQVVSQIAGTNTPSVGLIDEERLSAKIADLWSSEQRQRLSLKDGRAESQRLKSELGGYLSTYKEILVGTGRDGQWLPFLRTKSIPRATADRLVAKHRASSMEKCLSEALPSLSTLDIEKLVKSIQPKLKPLRTLDSVRIFLKTLSAYLEEKVEKSTEASEMYVSDGPRRA
jgi:hypothetical protein